MGWFNANKQTSVLMDHMYDHHFRIKYFESNATSLNYAISMTNQPLLGHDLKGRRWVTWLLHKDKLVLQFWNSQSAEMLQLLQKPIAQCTNTNYNWSPGELWSISINTIANFCVCWATRLSTLLTIEHWSLSYIFRRHSLRIILFTVKVNVFLGFLTWFHIFLLIILLLEATTRSSSSSQCM